MTRAIALLELAIRARSVLVLIGLALFIAAGLDPVVSWLTRRRVPRGAAVVIVLLALAGVTGGFMAAAIPPLAAQTSNLVSELPHFAHVLQNHNSELGRLNAKYHIQQHLSHLLATRSSTLIGGVLGAGALVLDTLTSTLIVSVLVVYFLAGMPQIKRFFYRLAPDSRRARVILLGDDIFTKVGRFVLGNVVTSVIAGLGTYLWMLAFGIPYPILLALFVALLDLIPVIGSTVGGAVVSAVALTVSLPVAIATLAFYIGYRLFEDYLLTPRIMGGAVKGARRGVGRGGPGGRGAAGYHRCPGGDPDIAVLVSAQAGHGVGQIRECVDQGDPDQLADGAHLAFAVEHPLAAPYLERHVAEAGIIRTQVNHALDIVRPVGGKERADRRLSAVFASCRAGPECPGSHRHLTPP